MFCFVSIVSLTEVLLGVLAKVLIKVLAEVRTKVFSSVLTKVLTDWRATKPMSMTIALALAAVRRQPWGRSGDNPGGGQEKTHRGLIRT